MKATARTLFVLLLGSGFAGSALAAMDAPYNFTRPVRLIGGLYVCGDHRGLPNIEGALASASRAADAVLADLRRRSAH